MMTYEKFFQDTTPVQESAPGRVNLLGEHTTAPEVLAEIVRRATGFAPVVPA